MNENINIAEILKDAPKGIILYSQAYGDVEFLKVTHNNVEMVIKAKLLYGGYPTTKILSYSQYGVLGLSSSEFLDLLPCKGGSWENFSAPWKHKHFDPFDKVMVQSPCRNLNGQNIIRWIPELYGYWNSETKEHVFIDKTVASDKDIFPFDKNLVGKEVE